MTRRIPGVVLFGTMFTAMLPACAAPAPPLPSHADLVRSWVVSEPTPSDLPRLEPGAVDLAHGLDELQVVKLALLNNPALKADRLRVGVSDAQIKQAGVLPDPELDMSVERSSTRTGYSVGLSEELGPLFSRGAAKAAARANRTRVRLDIRWEEWQVAERASELYSRARAQQELAPVLAQLRAVLNQRYQAAQSALTQGTLTSGTLSSELVALADVEERIRRAELDANHTRHRLNAVLGLAPETKLRLRAPASPQPMAHAAFQAALRQVAERRADLLALRAGYRSSQERLRQAVIGQFPPVTVGIDQQRSVEEGVLSLGLMLDVRLPLFDGNRGQVAIGRATRAELRAKYQARLDSAINQANETWDAIQILSRDLATLKAKLPALAKAAAAAKQSFKQGNLDIDAYAAIASYSFTEQADAIDLAASLHVAQVTLRLLLGLPFAASPIDRSKADPT